MKCKTIPSRLFRRHSTVSFTVCFVFFYNVLELKRATRLYLKDNKIEKLEPVYEKNTILCEIDLQNNALMYIHPEFTTNLKVKDAFLYGA